MPSRALANAMLVAIVLLPTPPFALLTAMTLVTFAIGRFSGRLLFIRAARFGGVPARGNPWHVVSYILHTQHYVYRIRSCRLDLFVSVKTCIATYQWVLMTAEIAANRECSLR
jgi:hypothetical protein